MTVTGFICPPLCLVVVDPFDAANISATTLSLRSRSRDRASVGGVMLFKVAVVLLLAWVGGVAGLYDIGELVHVLLLVGLMMAMLGVLKARDGALRGAVDDRRDE